jgi:hypothetical protein
MKNKLLIFVVLLTVVSFTSCTKFLDVQPESSISADDFYKNDKEVGAGVVSCYDGLQSLYNIDFILTEIRSDNTTTLLHEGDYELIDHFKDGPSNSVTAKYWRIGYNTIFRTNTILANINNVSNAALKKQYTGEVLFIRALNYFNLVRLFGDIPLITHVIYGEDVDQFGRTPANTVYDTIISDFQRAANLLPKSYSSNDLGRATKGAAIGMLAKVFLTLHRYTDAKPLLEELINGGYNYSLMASYYDVFYKEMNSEILFAVRYKANSTEGQTFSSEMTALGATVRGNNPTQSLLSAYDSPSSIRHKVSIYNDGHNLLCGKYLSKSDPAGNEWIVLRYADVLLMYAEVTNEISGPTQEGISAFNKVRSRAGLSTYTVSDFTKDSFRQAIYKERRVELAFEDHRWFDLLRTGQVDSVMTAHGQQEGFAYESYRQLYAIPQREIDVSGGALTQNPGY